MTAPSQTDPAPPGPSERSRRRPRIDDTDAAGLGRGRAAAFVAPALLLISIFLIFPALWTLYLGLTNWRLTGLAAVEPEFVGLDNYLDALTDPSFHNSLLLTLLFVFFSAVVGQSVLGFSLAWTTRRLRPSIRSLLETVVLLAWIIPASVIAFLWIALLSRHDGTLNALLGTEGTAWLLEYPMQSIIIFNIWNGTAFSMLLFSSALASVPPSQFETARMSGAGTLATLRDVVFPNIRGHILTNTLLITLWTFNVFTPYLITRGGPEGRSEILGVYIYRVALNEGALGRGAALSLIMILINLVIASVYLRLLRERKP
ncbi:carbohydrate ABC transporter membrane protein 1 (CUT1 family) [Haloactinopolyspora alba]|uniref:Carbohydrate ABC transporter membrane protein 1 (CUT1 family) n=1 Tax=Haloactinopolyspora alba TaxID=648780 RepID=A0A2P8DZV3_9ACTN|nr:sugar ABC transporter permease [Haloactinopolyspora alba]PSL02753.1 carbohydrate ABC transporter membrane protein 1 (CUT1 family) [Haloactinopolyspora alba]